MLDGLHEDLNRVLKKPYVEMVEVGERDDETVAAEAWASYLQRDRSVIVDQFQGQLKSTTSRRCAALSAVSSRPSLTRSCTSRCRYRSRGRASQSRSGSA